MKLDHLYSLRRNFTVIGLTGRTGSGCTTIARLLSGSYEDLKKAGLREFPKTDDDLLFIRKYEIIKNFIRTDENWVPFEIIAYKNILLLFLFKKYGESPKKLKELLSAHYRENKHEFNEEVVKRITLDLIKVNKTHKNIIKRIINLKPFEEISIDDDLIELNDIFFGSDFKDFSSQIFSVLESGGYFRRTYFLHNIACNIRQSGDPLNPLGDSVKNIYTLSNVINRIIKAKKRANGKEIPTRIVIDSLRNSLEIMFFRERYSAFYMLATKDVMENSEKRILKRLPESIDCEIERLALAHKLLALDAVEYKTKDFSRGLFSSPDVENCIQKSDYHILNLKQDDIENFLSKYDPPWGKHNFLTREEQVLKLVALITQPGLVTPSSVERSMQIANTGKLNSGCISRSVGAAITDSEFYIQSVGWNDVAKGHTPCSLRDVQDIINPENESVLKKSVHYSPFEKGNVSPISSYKYKNEKPGNFKEALTDYFKDSFDKNNSDLQGKNCAFCFKTVHNHYEGEANQVHTRSLHAEENAMLQITKLGGQGVKNGILFTTASPCELCSKKAYQLGIKTIYFIDPYPGISNDQILSGGKETSHPKMIPFSGAIGIAYHKLYDSFMSYKDEISMTLELKSKNKLGIQFKEMLKSLKGEDDGIRRLLEDKKEFNDEDVIKIIKTFLISEKKN